MVLDAGKVKIQGSKNFKMKGFLELFHANFWGISNAVALIRPRGEEWKEKQTNPDFKARRWVVEVTHSFFNRFRKLLVRFEKKAGNDLALLHFASAAIVWRKFPPVHL